MKYKFVYYGIQAPKRKKIFQKYTPTLLSLIKKDGALLSEIVMQMWENEQREWQYSAMELFWKAKKQLKADHIEIIERLILSNSWWDTVDMLATKIAGHYFKKYGDPGGHLFYWIKSENLWLNRSAIIHQLHYKKDTNLDLLLQSILPHIQSKEFFHRKAIGWALRQYSRTDPEWVIKQCRVLPLSPLSKKEALRLIKMN